MRQGVKETGWQAGRGEEEVRMEGRNLFWALAMKIYNFSLLLFLRNYANIAYFYIYKVEKRNAFKSTYYLCMY